MKFATAPLRDKIAEWLGGSATAELFATLIMLGIATLLFISLWILANRLVARLGRAVDENKGRRIKTLSIQKQRLFSVKDIAELLHSLAHFLGLALKAILILLFLNVVFSYFHWSRGTALTVFGYIGDALAEIGAGIIGYIPELIIVVIVIVIARFAIRLLRLVFDGIRSERISIPGFYAEWAGVSFNLARLMVIVLTIIVVFPYLPGSGSPAFQGLSIFFGVLLSLGSSSAIANIIAGIVITYTRAFQIGDRVRISDTEGDVIERSAFVTRIRTPKNVEVAIPNSMVMSDHIVNFSTQAKEAGVLLHTTVTIGYDVPWQQVHELLREAAARTDKLMQNPEPFVLQISLDDNYVAYELNAYTHEPSGKQRIFSELHANIQDCFHGAGVEILSPHYRATRDGNPVAIPGDPAGEAAPGEE